MWAMPRLLAIVDGMDGVVKADSERDAAAKCTAKLKQGQKLGRSVSRREQRMRATIGAAIDTGYLTFSQKQGLVLTDAGKLAIQRRRESFELSSRQGRRHPQLARV